MKAELKTRLRRRVQRPGHVRVSLKRATNYLFEPDAPYHQRKKKKVPEFVEVLNKLAKYATGDLVEAKTSDKIWHDCYDEETGQPCCNNEAMRFCDFSSVTMFHLCVAVLQWAYHHVLHTHATERTDAGFGARCVVNVSRITHCRKSAKGVAVLERVCAVVVDHFSKMLSHAVFEFRPACGTFCALSSLRAMVGLLEVCGFYQAAFGLSVVLDKRRLAIWLTNVYAILNPRSSGNTHLFRLQLAEHVSDAILGVL